MRFAGFKAPENARIARMEASFCQRIRKKNDSNEMDWESP